MAPSAAAFATAEIDVPELELTTPAGRLRVLDDGAVVRARGVRYATAGRWAASEPVAPWDGVVDATQRGPAAPQPLETEAGLAGAVADAMPKSEDCLTLAVTAPAGAHGLPVIVFFHGGSYVTGAGDAPRYDPARLAVEGDVVVVSVNARLGILGYLPPSSAGEANLALRDQLLALRWVQDQVAAFGGDPGRVTLWGQSAGADTVLDLCLVREAEGWFDRVIMTSAPLPLRKDRAPLNLEMTRRMDAAIGPDPSAPSTDELLALQERLTAGVEGYGRAGQVPLGPFIGEAPLPTEAELPARYAEAAQRIELLIGATRDDALPFVMEHPWGRHLPKLGAPGLALQRRVGRIVTGQLFTMPGDELAERWRGDGGRATTFRVDWHPPGTPLRACHCIDLTLLLGTPADWADARLLDGHPPDEAVGSQMRRTWGAFAHGGTAALATDRIIFG